MGSKTDDLPVKWDELFCLVVNPHLREPVAQGVAGEPERARGLALVAVGDKGGPSLPQSPESGVNLNQSLKLLFA